MPWVHLFEDFDAEYDVSNPSHPVKSTCWNVLMWKCFLLVTIRWSPMKDLCSTSRPTWMRKTTKSSWWTCRILRRFVSWTFSALIIGTYSILFFYFPAALFLFRQTGKFWSRRTRNTTSNGRAARRMTSWFCIISRMSRWLVAAVLYFFSHVGPTLLQSASFNGLFLVSFSVRHVCAQPHYWQASSHLRSRLQRCDAS